MNIRPEVNLPPCAFSEGEAFEKQLVFDVESIKQFARMCGDTNPLHHDEEYAKTSRFGGLIASGAHYSALMMGAVAEYLTSKGGSVGLEFSFAFKKAVPAGSRLMLTWTITEVTPKESLGGYLLRLEGVLSDSDGALHVTATCKALVM